MSRYKYYILGLLIFLLLILTLSQVYNVIDSKDTGILARSAEYRSDIETPAKKWLNGHFGVFFRFRSLGNINWLALPLVLWFLLTGARKNRERWQLALAFVWLATLVFISVKGYYNSRYQFTLFPFTTGIVILLLWELLKEKQRVVKIICYSLLTAACVYNVYHYFNNYEFFWNLRVSRTTAHFPSRIVNYLNSHEQIGFDRSKVFIFNQPLYYYHTEKRGIDYMSPYHYEIFMRLTDKEGNRHKMHNIIRIKQKVKYILLAFTMENQYKDRMITEFLNCESNLLITEHGYKLYEIRDSRLNVRLRKPRFKRLKDVRLFSLKNHGIRGTFDLNKDRNKKIFTVSNKNADGKGNRLIQLGFHFTSGGSENQIPAGKYIHLLVEAKIPRHLLNRQNYVFIQDFVQHRGKGKKQWQRDKLYFSSPHWRTYRVSRELSENSSQFMLGIRFNPNSPEDKLVIKNIRAYVSNTPL